MNEKTNSEFLQVKSINDFDNNINNDFIENDQIFHQSNKWGEDLFDANGNTTLSEDERIEMANRLEIKLEEMLDILRINRNDPNSTNTPHRVAKMFVNELFIGRYTAPPKLTVFPNRKEVNELIISKGITVMSICSHHWQTISGTAAIGYIPGEYIIGLSKLSRITEWFCRRAQIQEELGEQIADFLEDLLKPKALGVVIKSKHYCMIARGVSGDEDKSAMVTSVMRGYLLRELNLRQEFLKLIND